MPAIRMILIVAMVLVAAAATVLLAKGLADFGAPVWQAALGPVLLGAFLVARWYGRRK